MVEYEGLFHILFRYILLWIFKLSASIYFKQVKAKGTHNIPKSGPVIFVIGPHANQFIDPTLVSQHCQREISFLCAEKSLHEPGIGLLLRTFNPIPVNRPQDSAVKGAGYLKSIDSCRIIGVNTKFTKQLGKNDYISFPKGYGEAKVVNIVSDTECIVDFSNENDNSKKLYTLFKSNNMRIEYRYMPHIEQETVYKKVYTKLNSGGTLGIFPEGGSHDRAQMLPLKAGVTIMALGAMAKYKDLNVKIVPCGMNYSQAHRFRSRVGIEFGTPITISEEMVQDFKKGGEAKREACSSLLNSIRTGLNAVTTNTDNHETLQFIKATRRLYQLPKMKTDIFDQIKIDRRLSIGYNQIKKDAKVSDLQKRIIAYQHFLKYYQINNYQLLQTSYQGSKTYLKLIINLIGFLFFLLLSAPGVLLNLPAAMIVDYISDFKAKAALKKSTVKIYGRDIISTWKILSCYILLPATYATYTLATLMHFKNKDIEFMHKLSVPIMVWCMLPYISYISLLLYEKSQIYKMAMTPLLLAIFDQKNVTLLRENYYCLSKEVTEIVNEYKTKIFPDLTNNEKKPDTTESKPVAVLDIPNLSQTVLKNKSSNVSNGLIRQEDDQSLFSTPTLKREESDESFLLHLSKTAPRDKENKRARRTYEYYKTSKIPELFKRKTRRILRLDDELFNKRVD